MLEHACRWRVSQGSSNLNSGIEDLVPEDKIIFWAINFQNPFKTFVQKPIFQISAMIIAMYLIYDATRNGLSFDAYGVSLSQYLELTISATHSADIQEQIMPDAISSIQFTRERCNITRTPNISVADSCTKSSCTYLISFPSAIEMDGIVLSLNKAFACDTIRFQAAGSTDRHLGWRVVAASTFRKRRYGMPLCIAR